jgi:hypothetical protein
MGRYIGVDLAGLMFTELCTTSKRNELMYNMSLYMSETRENRENEEKIYNKR